jgi:hypothetical protein
METYLLHACKSPVNLANTLLDEPHSITAIPTSTPSREATFCLATLGHSHVINMNTLQPWMSVNQYNVTIIHQHVEVTWHYRDHGD